MNAKAFLRERRWVGVMVACLLAGSTAMDAAPPRRVRVSAGCLSAAVGPFTGTIPGTGGVRTELSTFDASVGYPLHTVLPDGTQFFNGELAPEPQSPSYYRADYVTFDARGGTNQFGQFHISLPQTDTDGIGLPDILQLARPVATAFSGFGSVLWPVAAGFNLSGQITRDANASTGTFSATLTVPGNPGVNYTGPWHLVVLEGEATYERVQDQAAPQLSVEPVDMVVPRDGELRLQVAAGHRIDFAVKRRGPTGAEELLVGTTTFTVVGPDELALPAFVLAGPGVQYRVLPLSLKRSGHRYTGPLAFDDGDPQTPWVDFENWVVVVTDDNDEDGDGIPDLTDPLPDPGLVYQWFRDGVPVERGTNADLMVHSFAPAVAGRYRATVRNSHGSTTSRTGHVALSDYQWAGAAGGSALDWPSGLASGADGAFYLCGAIMGNARVGAVQVANLGTANAFVARYHRGGRLDWVMPLQSTGNIQASGAAPDAIGGVRIAGQFTGGALVGTVPLAGTGSFVGRADVSGQLKWVRASPDTIAITAVAVDPAGNAFVAGRAAANGNLGGQSVGPGIFAAKYDPDGTVSWARYHYVPPGTAFDQPTIGGITVDPQGNVAVTGGLYTLGPGGYSRQGLVACWDAAGNEKWYREFGGNGTDSGQSVVSDPEGNLHVAASMSSSWLAWDGTVVLQGTAGAAVGLLKITPTGRLSWWRTLELGPADGNQVLGLAADGRGQVCLATQYYGSGYSLQIDGITLPDTVGGASTHRALLGEYDREGRLRWVWQMPSTADARSGGVAYDPGGNLSATCAFLGIARLGSMTRDSAGSTDILVFNLARAPVLEVGRTVAGLRVSWPSSWWDAGIESADTVGGLGVWTPHSGTVTRSGFDLGVDLAPDSANRFFRLRLPVVP